MNEKHPFSHFLSCFKNSFLTYSKRSYQTKWICLAWWWQVKWETLPGLWNQIFYNIYEKLEWADHRSQNSIYVQNTFFFSYAPFSLFLLLGSWVVSQVSILRSRHYHAGLSLPSFSGSAENSLHLSATAIQVHKKARNYLSFPFQRNISRILLNEMLF